MQTGTKISGLAHLGLLTLAYFGGAFTSEPLPFEAHEVSVISAEQFAALTAAPQKPDLSEQPAALTTPEPEATAPEVPAPADATPDQEQPAIAEQPVADPEPEPTPQTPEPDLSEAVPVLQPPEPQVVVETPPSETVPQPRPVDRVAPQPAATPPQDARPDPVAQPEVSPDAGAPTEQEIQEATAPEEATDQIVPDAAKPESLAPARSRRPPASRPTRPAAAPAPEPDTENAVTAALAQALAGGAETEAPVPTGPPLTLGEKDALRVAVSDCWNIGSLSSAAQATTVVVAVSLGKDGRPDTGSIRMLSSSGGSDAAANQAFEAARRAIIRCGARGYDLPAEKYGQWRDIEITFNPERMRIR